MVKEAETVSDHNVRELEAALDAARCREQELLKQLEEERAKSRCAEEQFRSEQQQSHEFACQKFEALIVELETCKHKLEACNDWQ